MSVQKPTTDHELQALLASLLEALQAEYSAAKIRDTERLMTLATQKTLLIEAVGKLSHDPVAFSDTILCLLKQCRQQNVANGQILQIGLRNAQRLHNILQGADGLPTAYDGDGEPTFSPHGGASLARI
ncbi:MAG TPA: hypothetical protein ENI62_03055 [Gammaproteobacteria bacterium]|nr:hypothetical protein [Gammaproteobacteria bacterium]